MPAIGGLFDLFNFGKQDPKRFLRDRRLHGNYLETAFRKSTLHIAIHNRGCLCCTSKDLRWRLSHVPSLIVGWKARRDRMTMMKGGPSSVPIPSQGGRPDILCIRPIFFVTDST
jgi:hypothetical protein